LLDYDYQEVRVARTIIENSRRVFLVTDHTKFGRSAMIRLGHIGEVHELFTDRPPPAAMADVIAASDCRVHVPGDEGEVEIFENEHEFSFTNANQADSLP
ncbi:MAG TPA: hypothetical protein VGO20_14960, partial [Arenibaculum sp.]|nr:hypothetical protein [Arenibaculum sp.]